MEKNKTWRNLREESRQPVGEFVTTGFRACNDQVKTGALCRIADAVEKMTGNWITLVRDRDNFQAANLSMARKIKRLESQVKKLTNKPRTRR